ncbi:MAG TPA: hypothetical protein DIT13_14085 [Verrucomicrobiales bacterium]|nr:hypothetical protein [Verrucomicrobiales bacterium]
MRRAGAGGRAVGTWGTDYAARRPALAGNARGSHDRAARAGRAGIPARLVKECLPAGMRAGYACAVVMIAFSYRREDSQAAVGRLADKLTAEFGKEAVFLDQDSIPLGVDFRSHVREVWARSRVVLVVIGERWFGSRPDGRRRLDESADHVRVEVEQAMTASALVIPILLDQTAMPKVEELPESLSDLPFLNALRLDTGRDFHHHADRLIRELKRLLAEPARKQTSAPSPSPGTDAQAAGSARQRSSALQSLGTRLAGIFATPAHPEPAPAATQTRKPDEAPPPVRMPPERPVVLPQVPAPPDLPSAIQPQTHLNLLPAKPKEPTATDVQQPQKGRFVQEEPTVVHGEDLDVPTFLRKKKPASPPSKADGGEGKLGRQAVFMINGDLVISGIDLPGGKIRFRHKNGGLVQADGTDWRAEIEEDGRLLRLIRNGLPEGFARLSSMDSVLLKRLLRRAASQ